MSELSQYEQRMRVLVFGTGLLLVLISTCIFVFIRKIAGDGDDLRFGVGCFASILALFGSIMMMVASDGVE